jgi:hypothetical protein
MRAQGDTGFHVNRLLFESAFKQIGNCQQTSVKEFSIEFQQNPFNGSRVLTYGQIAKLTGAF